MIFPPSLPSAARLQKVCHLLDDKRIGHTVLPSNG
jgi:hypothetical protein